MIEVKNLTKRYGAHTAVDGLSFRVTENQIFGFLGPNGAGKTTTMNIMTGYLGASEGDVTICGHSIANEPAEAKRLIGYLPEQPPLYPDMTAGEYLDFVAKIKGIERSRRREESDRVMELTGTGDVSGRLIRNLSKGFRQRVGLAGAIMGFPPVIILDEPTVGLDPLQIIEIRELIRSLSKGHTVVLSSHILSEISALCDRVLIISHGRMVADDTPQNLENRMRGGGALELITRCGRAEAERALASLEGRAHITFSDSSVEGETCFRAEPLGDDIREALFFAFADARLPILRMAPCAHTLEDAFLELTADEESRSQDGADTGGDQNSTEADGDRENDSEEEEA